MGLLAIAIARGGPGFGDDRDSRDDSHEEHCVKETKALDTCVCVLHVCVCVFDVCVCVFLWLLQFALASAL